MDALSVHHPNQNVTTASQINASDFSTFSLRCKLSKLKQNISFLKFLHAVHGGLVKFTQFCKMSLAIKSIPAAKTLLCSDHDESIPRCHSRHDHQRRK